MTRMLRPTAIQAFFLPRREATFQNLVDNLLLRVRATAHAASHNATFVWEFPFKLFVLFFYRHFRYSLAIHQPMRLDGLRKEIGSCLHQSLQLAPLPLLGLHRGWFEAIHTPPDREQDENQYSVRVSPALAPGRPYVPSNLESSPFDGGSSYLPRTLRFDPFSVSIAL